LNVKCAAVVSYVAWR